MQNRDLPTGTGFLIRAATMEGFMRSEYPKISDRQYLFHTPRMRVPFGLTIDARSLKSCGKSGSVFIAPYVEYAPSISVRPASLSFPFSSYGLACRVLTLPSRDDLDAFRSRIRSIFDETSEAITVTPWRASERVS